MFIKLRLLTNIAKDGAAARNMAPRMNILQFTMIVTLRPKKSTRKPEMLKKSLL